MLTRSGSYTHLALKRDSTKISDSRIKVVYYQDKFFDIGKSTLNINGVEVKVYDKERMPVSYTHL